MTRGDITKGKHYLPSAQVLFDSPEDAQQAKKEFQEIWHRLTREELDFQRHRAERASAKGWLGQIQTRRDGPWHRVIDGTPADVMAWARRERFYAPAVHLFEEDGQLRLVIGRVRYRVVSHDGVEELSGMTPGVDGEQLRRMQ